MEAHTLLLVRLFRKVTGSVDPAHLQPEILGIERLPQYSNQRVHRGSWEKQPCFIEVEMQYPLYTKLGMLAEDMCYPALADSLTFSLRSGPPDYQASGLVHFMSPGMEIDSRGGKLD